MSCIMFSTNMRFILMSGEAGVVVFLHICCKSEIKFKFTKATSVKKVLWLLLWKLGCKLLWSSLSASMDDGENELRVGVEEAF